MSITIPSIDKWNPYIGGYGLSMNKEIKDMINTVNRLEIWDWFRNENPPEDKGYSWWDHPNIDLISKGLNNNNHSGASFAGCLREIQFIAKNSWEEWNDRNCPK